MPWPCTLRIVPTLVLALPLGAQTTLFRLTGPPNSAFGLRVDLLGDVNGDGRGDFLVSAPFEANGTIVEAGAVHVYSGVDASELYTLRGSRSHAQLGYGASAAGDVDGDGFADFVVGAPG